MNSRITNAKGPLKGSSPITSKGRRGVTGFYVRHSSASTALCDGAAYLLSVTALGIEAAFSIVLYGGWASRTTGDHLLAMHAIRMNPDERQDLLLTAKHRKLS